MFGEIRLWTVGQNIERKTTFKVLQGEAVYKRPGTAGKDNNAVQTWPVIKSAACGVELYLLIFCSGRHNAQVWLRRAQSRPLEATRHLTSP